MLEVHEKESPKMAEHYGASGYCADQIQVVGS